MLVRSGLVTVSFLLLCGGTPGIVPAVRAQAAAGSPAGATSTPPPRVSVPHDKYALKNGLHVILVPDSSIPRVHLSMRVRVGSAHEKPGRTGFAHLFEHLMFEGSKHVPEGKFDAWLEAAGGTNNAWTSNDVTFYYEEAPENALELMLFLESDRWAHFVNHLSEGLVDGQRDVVKNERRQSYENRPYGKARLALPSLVWPRGHPYSWPVIGSMEDLSAASLEDVRGFFKSHYVPENGVLTLVGDFDPKRARALIARYFAEEIRSSGGRPAPPPALFTLPGERRAVFTDQVELPQLTLVWPTVPHFHPDDAPLDLVAQALSLGESSPLVRRLVHETRLATSVSAMQHSKERAGEFTIQILARPDTPLRDVLRIVDEELARLKADGPAPAVLARGKVALQGQILESLDSLGDKAQAVSAYAMATGDPDFFQRDLDRIEAVTAAAVQDSARRLLGRGRVVVSVVPTGRLDLAVTSPVLPSLGGPARPTIRSAP
jgi:zinc protease